MRYAEPITTLQRLLQPHITDLFQCAFALLGDRKLAESAVHEVCVRAQECLDDSTAAPQGRSWIFGLLLDQVRERRGSRSLAIRLFRANRDDDLLRAVRRLPSGYAELITLVDVQGFSYQEAAEALGLTRESVLDSLQSARKELRSIAESGNEMAANSRPRTGVLAARSA